MTAIHPDSARHVRWNEMPLENLKGGMSRRFVSTGRLMIAHVYFKKGDDVPRHAHDNEQITYILEGALHFWLGADDARQLTVKAGELIVIPANLLHRAVALEDTLDIDVFNPPRQDWLDGSDAYLRR